MFNLEGLRRSAENEWKNSPALRAAFGDKREAWLSNVSKLEYAPRAGLTEEAMVRMQRDAALGGGTKRAATSADLSKLSMAQLSKLLGPVRSHSAPAPAIGASSATAMPLEAHPADPVAHESADKQAEAAWGANTPDGARLRAEFGFGKDRFLAYERARRTGRGTQIVGGRVVTYKGVSHA